MARTKQEVRDFLNALQGLMVNEKCGIYNGQCVSLIKALLEFLGAPNPYAGRGNARDVGDTLVRQGLAKASTGWLNVCVNRDMGRIFENGVWNNYGHIWLDLAGEMNFEQNGNKALRTTKNTRPVSQAQQIVNLDQYIIEEGAMANPNNGDVDNILGELWGRKPNPEDYGYTQQNWHDFIYNALGAYPWKNRMADYADAVKKRAGFENALGIAEARSANFQRICDRLSIQRQPNEEATTDQIIARLDQLFAATTSIPDLQKQIAELSLRPTQKQLDDLKKAADDANAKAQALEQEKAEDEKTGNAFLRWLGDQLNKVLGKK